MSSFNAIATVLASNTAVFYGMSVKLMESVRTCQLNSARPLAATSYCLRDGFQRRARAGIKLSHPHAAGQQVVCEAAFEVLEFGKIRFVRRDALVPCAKYRCNRSLFFRL